MEVRNMKMANVIGKFFLVTTLILLSGCLNSSNTRSLSSPEGTGNNNQVNTNPGAAFNIDAFLAAVIDTDAAFVSADGNRRAVDLGLLRARLEFARALQDNAEAIARAAGVGTDAYNQKLSERRAQAVQAALSHLSDPTIDLVIADQAILAPEIVALTIDMLTRDIVSESLRLRGDVGKDQQEEIRKALADDQARAFDEIAGGASLDAKARAGDLVDGYNATVEDLKAKVMNTCGKVKAEGDKIQVALDQIKSDLKFSEAEAALAKARAAYFAAIDGKDFNREIVGPLVDDYVKAQGKLRDLTQQYTDKAKGQLAELQKSRGNFAECALLVNFPDCKPEVRAKYIELKPKVDEWAKNNGLFDTKKVLDEAKAKYDDALASFNAGKIKEEELAKALANWNDAKAKYDKIVAAYNKFMIEIGFDKAKPAVEKACPTSFFQTVEVAPAAPPAA